MKKFPLFLFLLSSFYRALLLLNKTIMKKLSETIVILRLCEPDTKKLKL